MRINIPNPYGVYMHDTPEKGVFGDDFRFVSSGCVRVQDVRDYVAWLLKDNPGWGRDQIDAVIRSGEREDVKLAEPVPVYWVYITAWATPDGLVQFRPDIYQRDGAGPGPVASAVPAAAAGAAAGIAAAGQSRRGQAGSTGRACLDFRPSAQGSPWLARVWRRSILFKGLGAKTCHFFRASGAGRIRPLERLIGPIIT